MSRSLTVHDLSDLLDFDDADVPLVATIGLVASEALAADVLLGKQHFYDAKDTRLSFQGYMACSSCHNEGGQDGRIWDFTQFGEGFRNSIGLNGHGVGNGSVHWTANFDEIQDFEGQIRGFVNGTGLMDDADFNQGTRSDPLGDPKAGISPDLDALAAYVESLGTTGISPHRAPGGALTAEAEAGKALFAEYPANCHACHGGAAYTTSSDDTKYFIGAPGPVITEDMLRDPPTLRDLWSTAPYLHNGSAAMIRDAIDAHEPIASGLSGVERDRLASYLMQIDDSETSAPIPVPEPGLPLTLLVGFAALRAMSTRRA